MQVFSVAIAGASGYAGGEAARWLLRHPDVALGALTAGAHAGAPVTSVHPHLLELSTRTFDATSAEVLAGHDAIIVALPHGQSAALIAQLPESTLIIDCGADFRLTSPEGWAEFYDTPYAGSWTYGLPELLRSDGSKARTDIAESARVAVPGCYPSAISLALAPGLAGRVLDPSDIVIVAATGTSGAGRALKPHLLGAEVMNSMSPYGVGGGHRHTPEIEQNLSAAAGSAVSVSFTPTLAPMPRGILATCTARATPGVTSDELRQTWSAAYADEPFVHLLPQEAWPSTGQVLGSNHVTMQLAHDRRSGRVIVVAAIDNLAKGTAGASVQCLNLMRAVPESHGLTGAGIAP